MSAAECGGEVAIFDLLMVKVEARRAERSLREGFSEAETPNWPSGRDGQ